MLLLSGWNWLPTSSCPLCTEGLALAQSRPYCSLRGFHSSGSPQDTTNVESGTPVTMVWLIQPDTPSCPVQAQHPDRLLTCPRTPARMALAPTQPCSNVTQLHHLQQLRQQLPRRSQWPGRQQALLGVPRLGIFLSGQDRLLGLSFQGFSPHLLLAGDHPHPPPPPFSPHHHHSSSLSSTQTDAHPGPAGSLISHKTISHSTCSLVPPLSPPRQLALSLWSNLGSSTGDRFI